MRDESAWAGPGWTIEVSRYRARITTASGSETFSASDTALLDVRRRWFSWAVYREGELLVRLRGLSRSRVRDLRRILRAIALREDLRRAAAWAERVERTVETALREQRWIPVEVTASLETARPSPSLGKQLRRAGGAEVLSGDELRVVEKLARWNLHEKVAGANEQIMAAELTARKGFFDSIEKSPLTEEQARAVVCFDNRVQVLAAAGSGKTSVMVARAAYAVDRGLVPADRILLLAFNRAAADELRERVRSRFDAAGIDDSGVRASTFHSFGLKVIGAATGKQPRLASWLDPDSEGIGELERIVDELRDKSQTFRYEWDLFRLLFAGAPTEIGDGTPDGYDPEAGERGYRTLAGEVVKSHGERLVADFLYLSGVNYVYERPYEYEVADAEHGQYRPDFYYPDVDVWHEHWALDRDGNPPSAFRGYAASMAWKRRTHSRFGTNLIESTWADVVFGSGLERLQADLESYGVVFDWNPDRPVVDRWRTPMKHKDLARQVRTFMRHIKSNSFTRSTVDARLQANPHLDGFRNQLFLRIYWRIHESWEQRLRAEGSVDFEDMLVRAADHLGSGEVEMPYELVLVDELQDASNARARLVRALMDKPGRFLLAVGDDWQAINRFAGADLSVMTDFASWFGAGPRLALTTTFRCPQTICDVASAFVTQNPTQFSKPMRSAHDDPGRPVKVIQSDDLRGALSTYLRDLAAAITQGDVEPGDNGKVTVEVLGRYRHNEEFVRGIRRDQPHLSVQFRTVHRAKGLEADYVVLPDVSSGTYGFPSTIVDDPVLHLATPAPESFPYAEERRLFYVALTRARREVVVIAPLKQTSPFVVEISGHPHVVVEAPGGHASRITVCPQCRLGTLVERSGRYGPFLGCSTFPACRHTRKLES